jgi:mRNA-degrading endonuclease RelE of RelBE toxin-antitoxin system
MGIVQFIHSAGHEDPVIKDKKLRKALKKMTEKLEKKAAKLRKKLAKDSLPKDERRHLAAKLAVVEAQIIRGHNVGPSSEV